jgi:hypothetical protein
MNTKTNTNTNAVRELLKQIKANKASSDKLRDLCLSNAISWTQWHRKDQELLEAWSKLAQSLSNATGMRYSGHYPDGVSFEAAQELPEFYESKFIQSEEA